MKISTKDIANLRKDSGCGIMDCREALTKTQGDLKKAKEYLRKKGLDKAAKKSGRKTGAGIVHAYIHNGNQVGVLLVLACETDFVARTVDFKKLATELCMQIAAMNPKTPVALLKQEYIRDPGKKIDALVKEAIAKLGENIKVVEFCRLKV